MNDLALALGIADWKPFLGALILPPVPLLLLVLWGALRCGKRPIRGGVLLFAGVLGLWLSSTTGLGTLLNRALLAPQSALTSEDIAGLRRSQKTVIVVLGGGRRWLAPEYGMATLKGRSIERLRYGIWLSRETGLPLAFSGGVGHGAVDGSSEAESAGRIAEREFGRPLRWLEGHSRDTHENAVKTLALLQPQGIEKVVLVTSADHMPRALLQFQAAAQSSGIRVLPAPMDLQPKGHLRAADWLPSPDGYELVWVALHEWLGRLAGA
jgi:uncharacterized SAM-binding protein YcdF (DUF218 family)